MPAHSKSFPWPSYYGHFRFFEMQMRKHNFVSNLTNIGDGVYELILTSDVHLRVFVCECYSYGTAEYIETTDALANLDAIIISSNWCSYTPDAKRICREQQVGLFNIRDFMGALNRPKFWSYLSKDETELFKERGWL